ncbi:hypothetical protein D9M71_143270 [compost metagenome]
MCVALSVAVRAPHDREKYFGGLVTHQNVLKMGNSRALLGGASSTTRLSHGNGVRTMDNLTHLERLFLELLRRLNDQQRQDVQKIMEALAQLSE